MGVKFSIVKTIDLDKLNNEINNYKNLTNEENPYIFMNGETIKKIAYDLSDIMSYAALQKYRVSDLSKYNGLIGYWKGNKMFTDNTLNFGEVEIR